MVIVVLRNTMEIFRQRLDNDLLGRLWGMCLECVDVTNTNLDVAIKHLDVVHTKHFVHYRGF